MGTITSVRVREGDRVRRGDALATIDERQVGAQRRQAEAALAEARQAEQAAHAAREAAAAGAELAAATHRRYQAMLAMESVSRQEFDEVDARRRQAQAALDQAEDLQKAAGQRVRQAAEALAAASVSAGDATVTAAFDGIVTARLVDPGDLAAPGKPLLNMEKAGGHRVDIRVPEAHVRSVRTGQAVSARVEGPAPVSMEGVVDVVAPAADPASRSFLVKVRLPSGADVRSGMFVRVALAVGEDRLTAVPASALIQEGQLTGLYLVTAEGRARFRLVRTGRRLGDRVEVISGLAEGSRFVVDPPPDLMDGSRVEASS
jgi:RND family efflux transporter MFP subunit